MSISKLNISPTPSNTATNTPSNTATGSPCPTSTVTPTNTASNTATPTLTPTQTNICCSAYMISFGSLPTTDYFTWYNCNGVKYTAFTQSQLNYIIYSDTNYGQIYVNHADEYVIQNLGCLCGFDCNQINVSGFTGNEVYWYDCDGNFNSSTSPVNFCADGSQSFDSNPPIFFGDNSGFTVSIECCPSPTPTITPTITSTQTITPTQTNTSTPNALCTEQLYFSAFTGSDIDYTFNRLHTYSGGSLSYGWYSDFSGPFYANQTLGGNAFAVFGAQSGSTYYTIIRRGTASPESWKCFVSTGDYIINGGISVSGLTFNTALGILSDGIYYPPTGFGTSNNSYLYYSEVCPTATPTFTPTQTTTPTNTSTNTPTPSVTNSPTTTNTPTTTPTATIGLTPTSTPSETPTNTPTSTLEVSPTSTPTNTQTETPTTTTTPTSTSTPTGTLNTTSTPTVTPTQTNTPTPSTTPICDCYQYEITNYYTTSKTVFYTDCDGTPSSVVAAGNGQQTFITCAVENSLSTNDAFCDPGQTTDCITWVAASTPCGNRCVTPTTTPTNTSTPTITPTSTQPDLSPLPLTPTSTPTNTPTPSITPSETPPNNCVCYLFQNEDSTSSSIFYTPCGGSSTSESLPAGQAVRRCIDPVAETPSYTGGVTTIVPCTSQTSCTEDNDCTSCS